MHGDNGSHVKDDVHKKMSDDGNPQKKKKKTS
jgi:hypothetical protein